MLYVEANFDHHAVGCGWRRYVNKGERQKLRGMLRAKVADFKRLGMRYSKAQVKRALERLA